MPWGFTLYHLPHGHIEVFFFSFSFFLFCGTNEKTLHTKGSLGKGWPFSIHHHIIAHMLDI